MSALAEGTAPLKYRLGIDLGSGSLGWALLELDEHDRPCGIIDAGSRIFGTGREPKSLSSLAANRRQARQARRRRDRSIQRRKRLMHELVNFGLMPEAEEERQALKSLNPYELRHRGIRERLEPFEIGRALFHLQQRRGFKSNRKADRKNDEKSAMKAAIRELEAAVGPEETVGSFLYRRLTTHGSTRMRPTQRGGQNTWEFYVGREMLVHEFDRLWETQRAYHPELLTEEARQRIREAIFRQRPLKPVDPGRCTLEPDEKRAPIMLASSQLFRNFQEVNALRVIEGDSLDLRPRPLTREERDAAIELLRSKPKVTFAALKTRVFGKGADVRLTHEEGERAHLLGDVVSAELARDGALGSRWHDLTLDEQDEITRILHDADSDEDVVGALTTRFGFSEHEARGACEASLPDGYYRFSHKAIRRILPYLIDWDEDADAARTFDKAVAAAGYSSHSDIHSGEIFDQLPYYGRVLYRYTQDLANRSEDHVKERANPDEWEFGRIANPTVHVGLNQLRVIVNAIVKRYGPPFQVHVELARELGQSAVKRLEASRKRSENERRNEALAQDLQALGQINNHANRERLRLYEELAPLDQMCVLCGERIERSRLFQPGVYEVDHILPFSRTLDDSFSNKHLIHTQCNRFKKNRSPYEAYGELPEWPQILERAEAAYRNNKAKLARFASTAMERYESGGQDFIARQLTDTSYLARVAREYLTYLRLSGDDGFHPERIVAMPGRLTGLLRAKWGLNDLLSSTGAKERSDHRHHAIDAIVIALSDRATLKAVTDANRRAADKYAASNDDGFRKLLDDLPEPWTGFTEDARAAIGRIVVSHKPDHNEKGALHEETALGVRGGPDKEGRFLVRKKGEDERWRPVVPVYRRGEGPDSSLPYKAYVGGSNYCIEIVRASTGKWEGEVISTFQANQRDYQAFMRDRRRFLRESFSGRPLVMRLIAGDTVAIEREPGKREIWRLYKMSSQKTMYFAPVNEGNVAARVSAGLLKAFTPRADPLRKVRARRVFVDPLGRVHDPGFRE